LVDPGEQCDDGNGFPDDGCVLCANAFCGDGFVWIGHEACDDGNSSNSDACVAGCTLAQCGDGFLHAGVEQCDDGNLVNGDGCSSMCTLPICGDGIQDPPEACDLGPANADRPALLVSWDVHSAAVTPIDRTTDAALFYNYFSASSHTGYEELHSSRLFFYRDTTTGVLSLFMHHGIDFNTSMQQQPPTDVLFDITGLPSVTLIAVSDDGPGEFNKTSATTAQGNWHFQANSDGGVLSGLPFPGNWSVDISPTFTNSITGFQFVNGDDSLLHLYITPVTLTAFDTPSPCRLDCTIPTCGDGVLDGGEVCDDGNTQGGDGCSADCKSLN
jgi:cysteine-rich repeat protein